MNGPAPAKRRNYLNRALVCRSSHGNLPLSASKSVCLKEFRRVVGGRRNMQNVM